MTPTVSIIIPVYNAEKYLGFTLDSVLSQTYNDLEIILVDDGSIDKSMKICQTYSDRDARVKVVHQKNNGVSAARNAGLNCATGDYIQFVDSDDIIDANMTEKLVHAAIQNNSQLVICGYYNTILEGNKLYDEKKISFPTKEYSTKQSFIKDFGILLRLSLISSLWNKLYSLEIIRKKKILFNTGFILGEDLLFNLEYLNYCNVIFNVRESYYHYIYNPKSITKRKHNDYWDNQKHIYGQAKVFLLNNDGYTGRSKKEFESLYLTVIISAFQNAVRRKNTLYLRCKEVKNIMKDTTVIDALRYGLPENQFYRIITILMKWHSALAIVLLIQFKNLLLHS